ncbi:MAG: DUF721 domain-containing protein [Desulfatirhabdiaceae bacterium]
MNQLFHIGQILKESLKSCRKESAGALSTINDIWTVAVGPDISENSRPAAIKKELLLVYVTSPVWIHHLHFSKQSIIGRLNDLLGKAEISDIKFKIGPV